MALATLDTPCGGFSTHSSHATPDRRVPWKTGFSGSITKRMRGRSVSTVQQVPTIGSASVDRAGVPRRRVEGVDLRLAALGLVEGVFRIDLDQHRLGLAVERRVRGRHPVDVLHVGAGDRLRIDQRAVEDGLAVLLHRAHDAVVPAQELHLARPRPGCPSGARSSSAAASVLATAPSRKPRGWAPARLPSRSIARLNGPTGLSRVLRDRQDHVGGQRRMHRLGQQPVGRAARHLDQELHHLGLGQRPGLGVEVGAASAARLAFCVMSSVP